MKSTTRSHVVSVLLVLTSLIPALAREIKEPLETYKDAPAPSVLWATRVSPATVVQEGSFVSHQLNTDPNGLNIVGDGANEPAIAVDPTNPNRKAVVWRHFASVTSDFRQAEWAYTTDDGVTWIDAGIIDGDTFYSDPVMAADETGRFYYMGVVLTQTMYCDIWRSLDYGRSWVKLAFATGGDKEWLAIDTTTGSGHGFQYEYWSPLEGSSYGTRQFSRSTDGGFTWMNPIAVPNSPQWGTLAVDSVGNLFIGGINVTTRQFWCVRSSNAKSSRNMTFDRATAVNLGGDLLAKTSLINPDGLAGQVYLAADKSGTSTNNNVYMLASVRPTGTTGGTDVMFVRSTDGGLTFSTPRRINDDPVNAAKWHWFGTVSVAPNGRIDCIWLDSRNAANDTDSQLFYSFSKDGGMTWSANVAVSPAFDPFLGYPNQRKIGDYLGTVSDNSGVDVAYPATFNGEQDVYFVRVATPLTPDYAITIAPASQSVGRNGGTVSYTITVSALDGFNSPVTLSVTGLPAGVTSSFTPNPVGPGVSTLKLTVPSSTSQNTYPFTVTGISGTLTHSRSASVVKTK